MADIIYYGTVVSGRVAVYPSASTTYNTIAWLSGDDPIGIVETITEDDGTVWGRHQLGWSICSQTVPLAGKLTSIALRELTDEEIDELESNGNSNVDTPEENDPYADLSGGASGSGLSTMSTTKTTRLMGSPHQFNQYADHRIPSLSTVLGRKYIERVVSHAPIVTIIPGHAVYAAGEETGATLLRLASESNESLLENITGMGNDEDMMRYYDFSPDYSGYMDTVNLLCRTMAVLLQLDFELPVYKADGSNDMVGLGSYDWKNYRWDAGSYNVVDDWGTFFDNLWQTGIGNIVVNAVNNRFNFNGILKLNDGTSGGSENLGGLFKQQNYVQFYVDPDSISDTESFSNMTSTSQLKGIFESQNSTIKELAFIANAAGKGDAISSFGDAASTAISDAMATAFGGQDSLVGLLRRFTSSTANVIMGQNVIMPEIYQSSERSNSKQFTIKLQSPYGHPLAIYLNILVPLAHWIALTCPRNKTPNTYEGPFLLKMYYDGVYSCNLGIVESLDIEKSSSDWTADGLPTAITIQVKIKDLYSDLTTNSTTSGSTDLFVHNSSLIEFLATQCGLSLIGSDFRTKLQLKWNPTYNQYNDRFQSMGNVFNANVLGKIYDIFGGII